MDALNSCRRDGTYQVDIRPRMPRENPRQNAQQWDPIAAIEVRLGAVHLNAADDDTATDPVQELDDAPMPNYSHHSSSPSTIPSRQWATKDELALIENRMRSNHKANQTNLTSLVQLDDAIAQVVHDKALDLNDAQQSIDHHTDQIAGHNAQLADLLPRVGQLEAAQSRTDKSPSASAQTLEQMQRMRQGIKALKTHALAEARGTKRKFDQISKETSLIRADQKHMRVCLEQAWVAAGQSITDFLTRQMDQFGRQSEEDKQAVEGFYRKYTEDKRALDGFHRQYEAHKQACGNTHRQHNADQQDTLRAELRSAVEAIKASNSRPVQQSNGDVSHQPATDVPVARIEPEANQDRPDPSSNVPHQAAAISSGSVSYSSLPNVHAAVSLMAIRASNGSTEANDDIKPVQHT
ncbi:MAG: hypothetical protein LQ346_008768 [Caloplaca aetnensis]|nr:MAG: hypothetical protein LQ346_008768 [Caloplaca aetnensis]